MQDLNYIVSKLLIKASLPVPSKENPVTKGLDLDQFDSSDIERIFLGLPQRILFDVKNISDIKTLFDFITTYLSIFFNKIPYNNLSLAITHDFYGYVAHLNQLEAPDFDNNYSIIGFEIRNMDEAQLLRLRFRRRGVHYNRNIGFTPSLNSNFPTIILMKKK